MSAGQEGEILARGPECCLGYLNRALHAESFTADEWFRTGYLGTHPLVVPIPSRLTPSESR